MQIALLVVLVALVGIVKGLVVEFFILFLKEQIPISTFRFFILSR